MTDIAELIRKARDRTYGMVKPNVIDDLADALEALDRENQALAATLNARITP